MKYNKYDAVEFSALFTYMVNAAGFDQQAVIDSCLGSVEWIISAETEDGNVIGLGTVAKGKNAEWQLKGAYVLPAYRGQGIGKALVMERLKHLRSMEVSQVTVRVISEYSRRLYASLQRIGLIPDVIITDAGDYIR